MKSNNLAMKVALRDIQISLEEEGREFIPYDYEFSEIEDENIDLGLEVNKRYSNWLSSYYTCHASDLRGIFKEEKKPRPKKKMEIKPAPIKKETKIVVNKPISKSIPAIKNLEEAKWSNKGRWSKSCFLIMAMYGFSAYIIGRYYNKHAAHPRRNCNK